MRITFALFDFIWVAALAYFVITQIAVPAFRGTKLFPVFRREHKLREELYDVNQSVHEDELANVVRDAREHLSTRRDHEATERAAAAPPLGPVAGAMAAKAANAGPVTGLHAASSAQAHAAGDDGDDPPESWGRVTWPDSAPNQYAVFEFNNKSSLITLAMLKEFTSYSYQSVDLEDQHQLNAILHILATRYRYTAEELEKIKDLSTAEFKQHFQLFH